MTRTIRRSERFAEFEDHGWRAGWGPGPWQDEPDLVEWRNDDYPGVPMLVARSAAGHLCGYVAVPHGHPCHGKAAEETDLEAHGGLNYAASCGVVVCHVPLPGEPDDVWWLGFDCGHVMTDISPEIDKTLRELGRDRLEKASGEFIAVFGGAVYRTLDYVMAEVERLAAQVKP